MFIKKLNDIEELNENQREVLWFALESGAAQFAKEEKERKVPVERIPRR